MQERNHFGLEYDVVDREGKYNADRLMISLGIRKLTIDCKEANFWGHSNLRYPTSRL